MATDKYGCYKTPEDELKAAQAKLLRAMTSGIEEIENPLLGRTRYRSYDDLQRALALVNGMSGTPQGSVTVIRMNTSPCSSASGCGCPTSWNRWGDTL